MFLIKKILIWLSPRKLFVPTQIKIEKVWIGSTYGGFFVHMPALTSGSVVFSFGVGEDISFDTALLETKKLNVYAFDPTAGVAEFVEPQIMEMDRFSFSSCGIAARDGEQWFYPPENPDHISCSIVPNPFTRANAYRVEMKKLSTITSEMQINHIDLLKLDIEGAEYEVVPAILDEGFLINQIQIEIHPDLFADGRQKTKALLKRMNDAGYRIFGVSGTCRELSFIRTETS
jgi:FkbM family methyltransferase